MLISLRSYFGCLVVSICVYKSVARLTCPGDTRSSGWISAGITCSAWFWEATGMIFLHPGILIPACLTRTAERRTWTLSSLRKSHNSFFFSKLFRVTFCEISELRAFSTLIFLPLILRNFCKAERVLYSDFTLLTCSRKRASRGFDIGIYWASLPWAFCGSQLFSFIESSNNRRYTTFCTIIWSWRRSITFYFRTEW